MNEISTILYVEDNASEVELLLLCLDRYNFSSTLILNVAETVSEAKNMFDMNKHTAALIDWNLPDGEGTEVAQHIRAFDESIPIVFLSSVLNQQHLHEAEKYTPKAFLEKSYSHSFIKSLKQLLS